MAVAQAFLATQNCYFNYEFEEVYLDDAPEELQRSLRGTLFRHQIQSAQLTHFVYFSEILDGEEFEKMQADFQRYCPVE